MSSLTPLHYAYRHTATEATTGYFACEPDPPLALEAALHRLAASPMDEFLHRHVLRTLGAMKLEDLREVAQKFRRSKEEGVLTALLLECALLNPALAPLEEWLEEALGEKALIESLALTPLPYLTWSLLPDRELHSRWSLAFAANTLGHEKLPHPEEGDLPPLYDPDDLETPDPALPTLAGLHAALKKEPGSAWGRPPAQETATRALSLLIENAVIAGVEMRHEASLSPIALLRAWHMEISVRNGALNYSLAGEATTYGRGLSVADARASYAMEMVERASAYASVDGDHVQGLTRPAPLCKARFSELLAQGTGALDPNLLPLEAPYTDVPLYWMEAEQAQTGRTVLVPAQSVFLFCNLDEPALFMSPGSTGLASGNTLAEAKAAALTEIIERDAEAVTPYNRRYCFTLRSQDPRLQSLLDDYAARGVHVHFMDLTTEFGVPCYQAFVMGRKGEVFRATGAGLNGARAALSALTEVPYPYPACPPSAPGLKGLPERVLEELPDYSLESPTRNLLLLEQALMTHKFHPLYVELTREDLEMPVVRAIVPGLELTPEPDVFSRVPQRRYRNYLRLFDEN